MDWVETAVMRKAGLRGEMLMFSSSAGVAGQHPLLYLQSPLSSPSAEEPPACASVDRSGAWENFSVDDLLDLGGGKEQNGAGEDDFLRAAEAEDEEEEDEEEEERGEKEGKDSSSTGFNGCSSSALSFQAIPSPSSGSDPIVPAGDLADLEWVSRFVDDSYSEFPSAVAPAPLQNHHALAPAPVPEAEAPRPQRTSSVRTTSKRTWGSCCFSTDSLVVPAKLRSKRSGRSTAGRVWSLGLPPLLAESSTSSCSSGSSSASCSASSSIFSCLLYEKFDSGGGGQPHHPSLGGLGGGNPVSFQPALLPEVKKKKGRKPKLALTAAAATGSGGCGEHAQTRRRCTHCGVDKTPQWRAGPMGAKTLCNACGVRYKSGRLLPEYRPAGSPTFLSHVHSNSHRKVLEMRRQKELPEEGAASPPSASCSLLPPPPPPPPPVVVASQPYGVV